MGNIGNAYQQLHLLDSALIYLEKGYALDLQEHDLTSEVGDVAMLGNVYAALGNPRVAQGYYRQSIRRAQGGGITFALCRAYLGQARLFQRQGRTDSALYCAGQALAAGQQGEYPKGILEASQFLAASHAARRDTATAFRYLTLASATRDTLFGLTKMGQVQMLSLNERLRQQELAEHERQAAAQRRQQWLLAALIGAVPVLLLLWRNIRLKQQANRQLFAWNARIAAKRDALRAALASLKSAQDQLMRREKMAFLGELTAGIAHEPAKPTQLRGQLRRRERRAVGRAADGSGPAGARPGGAAGAGHGPAAQPGKIREHGQRASSIVKSMLEHSRHGSAQRAPTDVNALVKESLALAYQNLCASDPAFHATLRTELDPGWAPWPW
ncbi:hypothetical protein ACFQT0_09555 [Hymenobacter humi]|uniref:Tetratricopeptide repeat protein n=1 Tax=Hymenobacter humi TaxID=1411620 RepID=A0ABW2U596_9BACT